MLKIGAHVSSAVSMDLSIKRAKDLRAECTQIFISPPQSWNKTNHGEEELAAYKSAVKESGIEPNFAHGAYLINLATTNPEHLQKSIDWLSYAMNVCQAAGLKGVIFHTGSHKGAGMEAVVDQVVEALKTVFKNSESSAEPFLILENTAGSGGTIGQNFTELGQILRKVESDRVKICIDTQHAFGSGYDLRRVEGVRRMLQEVEEQIGLENLVAIHCNDSKVELGSHKDRHENIGEGFIGREGFKLLFAELTKNPKTADLSILLEVPGFAGTGPDQENIRIAKQLRASLNLP